MVSNLHTKFEDPSLIISQDIVRKPKCDGRTDGWKRQNLYKNLYKNKFRYAELYGIGKPR